jgi:hypothetical protein
MDHVLLWIEAGVLRGVSRQLESFYFELPDGATRDAVESALRRVGQAATILEQEADVLGRWEEE